MRTRTLSQIQANPLSILDILHNTHEISLYSSCQIRESNE